MKNTKMENVKMENENLEYIYIGDALENNTIAAEYNLLDYIDSWSILSALNNLNLDINLYLMNELDYILMNDTPSDIISNTANNFNINHDYFMIDDNGTILSLKRTEFVQIIQDYYDENKAGTIDMLCRLEGSNELRSFIDDIEDYYHEFEHRSVIIEL